MLPAEIIKAYEDPKIGVTSITKFAKNINYKGDMKRFRRILEMSNVFTQSIFARRIIKRKTRRFEADHISELISMDLMDITNYKLKYKFIGIFVDTFSRYLWTYPLLNKSKIEVAKAINYIYDDLEENGVYPLIESQTSMLYGDAGKEFFGVEKALGEDSLWKGKIIHYTSKSKNGAPIAEAYIKKLRQMITLVPKRRVKFVDILSDITLNINNTRSEIGPPKEEKPSISYFTKGSKVRIENTIKKDKDVFAKKSDIKFFSPFILEVIDHSVNQGINLYTLKTVNSTVEYFINRKIYEHEMSKVHEYAFHKIKEKNKPYKYSTVEINHYQLVKSLR